MKRCPTRDYFEGKMTTVYAPLSVLMRKPKGSTCLYLSSGSKFVSSADSMAKSGGGLLCIEPQFAINLQTKEYTELCRVTVVKPTTPKEKFRAPRVHVCAPMSAFARFKVGTTCLYENIHPHNFRASADDVNGKIKVTLLYAIDVNRGTNKPIHLVEVTKQGDPCQRKTKLSELYKNFY